jgi:hypothetical protein
MTNDALWYLSYMNGTIQRHDSTPDVVVNTIEDWFDGKGSAMRHFLDYKPTNPNKILSEINRALGSNNLGQNEDARLKEIQRWVIRESKMAEAAKALHNAVMDFQQALQDAGMPTFEGAKLFAAAIGAKND